MGETSPPVVMWALTRRGGCSMRGAVQHGCWFSLSNWGEKAEGELADKGEAIRSLLLPSFIYLHTYIRFAAPGFKLGSGGQ